MISGTIGWPDAIATGTGFVPHRFTVEAGKDVPDPQSVFNVDKIEATTQEDAGPDSAAKSRLSHFGSSATLCAPTAGLWERGEGSLRKREQPLPFRSDVWFPLSSLGADNRAPVHLRCRNERNLPGSGRGQDLVV